MISFTMIREYGYNIDLRELWIFFPLCFPYGKTFGTAWFLYDYNVSSWSNRLGGEGDVDTLWNGDKWSPNLRHENISRTPKYCDSLLPWIVWAVGEFSRGKIKRSKRRLRYKLGCSSSFPFPFFSSCWWKFEASALNVNIFFQRFHSLP